MNEMQWIKETIEGVIGAIHSVIQVDVTVIDASYNRIAATGQYVDQIGKQIAKNSVFYKALHSGKEYIVEAPREDEVCFDCENRLSCEEYAEVCCPIFVENQVVGIIGLVAFDEFQRNEVISNKLNLLNFLRQMAHLISSKLIEYKQQEKLLSQSKEIEVLFNYIDTAIVSVDTTGKVIRMNCVAKKLLDLNEQNNDYLPMILNEKQGVSDRIELMIKNKRERFIYQTQPIIIDNRLEQTVITFKKEKDLIHEMHDLVNMKHRVTFDEIIGKSEGMKRVVDQAKLSSKSQSTVLIQGESGTGKELFARAIHDESDRKNHPFVAINCAAIPESLIESELFGYADGAFTGALKGGKPGKFELASGGTIFLDEIGDMPIHLQSKLLRVLQEREVERVGGRQTTPIDVRVIAATHHQLETLIESRMFRADLYYRLNVIPLLLLPLRERAEDIEDLANFFLMRYKEKLKKTIEKFDSSVMACFKSYGWRGNVREMENTIEYAVNMCSSSVIEKRHLPEKMMRSTAQVSCPCDLRRLDHIEEIEIKRGIQKYGKDKEGIDKIVLALGISRATLYRKMKKYNL